MSGIRDILNILPQIIKKELDKDSELPSIQEIRMKIGKNLIYIKDLKETVSSYVVKKEDLAYVIQKISNYSIYAFEEELKQGYITVQGGHRVGICGACVLEENKIKTIKDIGSINIRISKDIEGCSRSILKYIVSKDKLYNTIIISPPKCGKTTLIRDIGRNISNGIKEQQVRGRNVCIIDERSEIAACYKGVPQMNVGLRTDVLDNCPKSYGIMMAIRSMAPEVVICDEIGTYEDMKNIVMALNCGVGIIATIHGNDIEDLFKRPVFKEVVENKVFQRAIVLNNEISVGNVRYIYDFINKNYIKV
ncbi:stage III sporulation protein AA [Hathewaya limosa]|uniref:Stage III sporulation protein AA n=1 Tax=Hathewaya limosa TaxID=1536 RepID=A0ABU0JRT9_HATLI|nr:stage III sporulation protein AA [Hathewaya limosa]MDQ0479811.1 stage III sporulation protein AA [Hathewaya limosa]